MFTTIVQRVKNALHIGPTPSGCCYMCRRPYVVERVRLTIHDRWGVIGGDRQVNGLQETCPKHGGLGRFTPDPKPEPSVVWRQVGDPWPTEGAG